MAEDVFIRRQFNGNVGKTKLENIRNPQWGLISGGVKALQPDWFLFAFVWCSQIECDNHFGHSCTHGSYPHSIKVCITQKDNSPEIYARLAKQAGPKPESMRRPRLSKKEQAARLYVMWGMPQQYAGDPSTPVSAAEYYGDSLNGRFIRRCMKRGLNWVILSPRHSIWGPDDQYLPGEKLLRETTPEQQKHLAKELHRYAARFEEVWLYSGRIHDRTELHKQVLKSARLSDKIEETTRFSSVR